MTPDESKAVVRRFFEEGISARTFDAIESLLAPTYKNYFPGAPEPIGGAGVKQAAGEMFIAFPDMRVEIHEMIAEGNAVATRYTMHATHQGPFQAIPATGKRIAVPGTSVHHVQTGKIVDDYPGFDALALMQQLGLIPQPVAAAMLNATTAMSENEKLAYAHHEVATDVRELPEQLKGQPRQSRRTIVTKSSCPHPKLRLFSSLAVILSGTVLAIGSIALVWYLALIGAPTTMGVVYSLIATLILAGILLLFGAIDIKEPNEAAAPQAQGGR